LRALATPSLDAARPFAPSLNDQWLGSGTPRMKVDAIAATPEQLRARGIVMKTESLWRDPRTVGP